MVYNYIPILRWKRGERVALRNVRSSLRSNTLPLFVLAPEQFNDRPANRSHPAKTAAEAFVDELINTWGHEPVYLDASAIPTPQGQQHPLCDIALCARLNNVPLMPATSLSSNASYQQAVVNVFATDKRGVALRVGLHELSSASSWLSNWQIPPSDTDLIADFSDNVATVHGLGTSLNHAFQSLHIGNQWRTVTSVGSSLPSNFGGYQAGLHTIPRSEWTVWTQLNASTLPYRLDYGDYATVPVNAPPPGIAWGFPINAKYTLSQEFLVARGVTTTGYNGIDMKIQLLDHARKFASFNNRFSINNCWGDLQIDLIATGSVGPGNLERWVQISVNRHVERVRTDLP